MRLHCLWCGKVVSTEVLEGTVIRASIECPECSKTIEDGTHGCSPITEMLSALQDIKEIAFKAKGVAGYFDVPTYRKILDIISKVTMDVG